MQVLRKAFKQPLNELVSELVNSIDDDNELVAADIAGSKAHCRMLADRGLLSLEQSEEIISGLDQVLADFEAGTFRLDPAYEDVHMNVEKRLEVLIGENALRLHTARSRNDQVALDFRLYVSRRVDEVTARLDQLIDSFKTKASENKTVVMPGYTHLQRAQPVFFSHALGAFVEMLKRDRERFEQVKERALVSPLGAGAQAGSGLPIDPQLSASYLGISEVFSNSIDAVCDRDFAYDFLCAAGITSIHLSQICETFIIWNSSEFGFVKFGDNVTTTSSLMPQKKNPDPVEIIRAKSGVAAGELVNMLMVLKGLPLGYNRDLQETKTPVIRVSKVLGRSLAVMAVVVDSLEPQKEKMLHAASDSNLMATDIVEYLVKKGVPFRSAHEIVAEAVQIAAASESVELKDLSLIQLKSISGYFENDFYELFDPVSSAFAKSSHGGTGSNLSGG